MFAAAVVIAFFLCWAPFHAQRLLYLYAKDSPNYAQVNELLYTIAGCFYYFSSTVNPILYNLMSMKYRRAFRETLCGYAGQRRNRLSRDLQSSFRETTVPLNCTTMTSTIATAAVSECRKPAPGYSSCGRPPQPPQPEHDYLGSSGTVSDVLVTISPATNGNAQCYKTLLRASSMGSKAAAAAPNELNEPRNETPSRFEIETCI